MKWIVRVGVALGLLLLIVGVGLHFSVNSIARNAIERSVNHATGVTTTVDAINIGLLGGTFQKGGLRLANPSEPPFDRDHFLVLRSADASVSLLSLLREQIVVHHLHMDGLELTIERKGGNENYRVIQENLRTIAQGEGDPDKEGRKFVVRELLITDIQVTFTGYPGLNRTLYLADIHMTDVGTDDDPVTQSEITTMVIKEIYNQLLRHPDLLPGMVVQGFQESIRGLGGLAESGVEFIGNITDGAGEILGRVGRSAGEAAEGIGDFFRGIFGDNGED